MSRAQRAREQAKQLADDHAAALLIVQVFCDLFQVFGDLFLCFNYFRKYDFIFFKNFSNVG